MKNGTKLALATISAFAVFCAPASAALVNQGYESGLDGWSSTGQVTATSEFTFNSRFDDLVIAPYQTQMARLVSGNTDAQSLETFFGLSAGTLDAAIFGDVTNGAGIKQSFTGLAGETVTQYYAALARDLSTNAAFVVVNGEVTFISATFLAGAPWQSFHYTLPADGTYTLGFGVVDIIPAIPDSYMLFLDNQAGSIRDFSPPIPEPETYAMLIAGLALLGFMAKRKSLSTT